MFRTFTSLAAITLATSAAHAQDTETPAQQNARINATLPEAEAAMKSHVMFLASDALKGRDAGSAEYDIAANYVASQFYAQGLRPAGDDNSYLQKVPLLSYKAKSQGAMSVVAKDGTSTALAFGTEFVPGADPTKEATSVEAQVVFVGYGIVGSGRDDYKGVDVKGKIVAFFGGAPRAFQGEERAHHGQIANKGKTAQDRGAIGTITLESPVTAKTQPFTVQAGAWDRVRMTWAHKDGSGFLLSPNAPSLGGLSMAGAAKLFDGSKAKWADVLKAAESDNAKFKPAVLAAKLKVTGATETKPVTSYNVAGVLPGSDPTLKDEVVVLSAHLDHVGVGKPDARGDAIHNGAMDNAVGIASLIEEAKRFKASGKAPKRSILFLAVTAEEKGLVGADYFAWNPTLPKDKLVANVNLDMPIITYKFDDIVVFGAHRSSLGAIVDRAAKGIGVTVSPDPLPDEGLFTRSDHYRFVQQGIPSVFLWPGPANGGMKAIETFLATDYHKPSDEIGRKIDWASGVRFVEVNYTIAREIADSDQRPVWNKGDFFGTLFKGPMAP